MLSFSLHIQYSCTLLPCTTLSQLFQIFICIHLLPLRSHLTFSALQDRYNMKVQQYICAISQISNIHTSPHSFLSFSVFIGIFHLQSMKLIVNIYLLAWLVVLAPVAVLVKGRATFNNGVPERDISTTTGLIGLGG